MEIPYTPRFDPCVGSVDSSSPAPSGLGMQAGLAPGYSQIGSKMQGVDVVEGRDLIANKLEKQGEERGRGMPSQLISRRNGTPCACSG